MQIHFFPSPPSSVPFPLWPTATFPVSLPRGARQSLIQEWGDSGWDAGLLRTTDAGALEVLYGAGWQRLLPGHAGHVGTVRMIYRYGPGHSKRGRATIHQEAPGHYQQLTDFDAWRWPRRVSIAERGPLSPDERPLEDLEFDVQEIERIENDWAEVFGTPVPAPQPPPAPPKPPAPAPSPSPTPTPSPVLPPLSGLGQRLEELREIAMGFDPMLEALLGDEETWQRIKPFLFNPLHQWRKARARLGDPRGWTA